MQLMLKHTLLGFGHKWLPVGGNRGRRIQADRTAQAVAARTTEAEDGLCINEQEATGQSIRPSNPTAARQVEGSGRP
jgi:hypothetical protein